MTAGADNFAIGGASVLKAYFSGEASGDEGWYLTQTLNYPVWSADPKSWYGWLKQARFSNFIETGAAWRKGESKTTMTDIGMAFNLSLSAQGSCSVSMAVAGEKTFATKAGAVRGFVSCSMGF